MLAGCRVTYDAALTRGFGLDLAWNTTFFSLKKTTSEMHL